MTNLPAELPFFLLQTEGERRAKQGGTHQHFDWGALERVENISALHYNPSVDGARINVNPLHLSKVAAAVWHMMDRRPGFFSAGRK